jgi:hypothetical protein
MSRPIVTPEAVSLYVINMKEAFKDRLPMVIEEVLYDDMNMRNFELPSQWNDEEFERWAKYDLEWNASEGDEEIANVEFAEALFMSNLDLVGSIDEIYIPEDHEDTYLYNQIENLIIDWSNDGTRTAGSLTRDILNLIN